ncbi:MAG: SUMF1/EgtB/PvdO family nonheme iron enzyme [Xenococcus sp. (in: cyanobacteria)]
MTRIFISHSHSDEAIAFKLVDFLLAALELKEKEILCTSNPEQGLSYSSSSITDQLKEQLKNSEALIVLITAHSLHSAWIPFEAGSFWTTDKPIIPILGPGLTQNDLPGPLKSFLSIPIEVRDVEDRLNSAIKQIAKSLNLQQEVTRRRNYKLQEFSSALKAWQSKRPKTDPATQEEITELKAQIAELEASSKKEQKELEQNYQSQQQKLEQQLQQEKTRIQQLEESEREQKKQLEELTGNYDNLQQQLQDREVELNRINQQLSQKTKMTNALQKELVIKRGEIDNLLQQTALDNKKQEPSQAQTFTVDLGDNITLEMIAIPSGKFLMGTADEEIERLCKKYNVEYFRAEKPQHKVTVQAFYMGIYPVTQAQYKTIMGNNPSRFQGDDRPVEKVSWDEAVEFCRKLSQQTGTEYRLPTEAEWEYACRAGTTTAYYFGDEITDNLVNYSGTVGKTTSVGQYKSNDFGLYDMHGNICEWCQDDWHDNYENAPNNGKEWGSKESSIKVIRGGSWYNNPNDSRSAYRYFVTRDDRYFSLGFRVVCVAPRTT